MVWKAGVEQNPALVSSRVIDPLADCLTCGQVVAVGFKCRSCGQELGIAYPHPADQVGAVGHVRRGLRRIPAIVLREHGPTLTVIDSQGSTTRLKASIFSPSVAVPNHELRTRSGRLLSTINDAPSAPMVRGLVKAALNDLALPEARSLALDAFTLGKTEIHDDLQFSKYERVWWRAIQAWRGQDEDRALSLLLELPDNFYAPRVAIFLAASDAALARFEPSRILATFSEDLRPRHHLELARLLVLGRVDSGYVTDNFLLSEITHLRSFKTKDGPLSDVATGLIGAGASSRILGALNGNAKRLGTDPRVLDHVPHSVIDDLIDSGSVPHQWAKPTSKGAQREYLQARLNIGSLSDEDVKQLGAEWETARRSVANGQGVPKDASAEVAAHFSPIAALLAGESTTVAEISRTTDLDPVELKAAFTTTDTIPDDAILGDAALAHLLVSRSTVSTSDIVPSRLSALQRQWLGQVLLRRAKSRLMDWEWTDTLKEGRQCLRFSQSEHQRDEALNMMAAAHRELGNDQAALAALTVALEDEYTEALLTNITVVASELEPEVAADRLSQLVTEAPNLEVKVAAARRAITLWAINDEPWATADSLPVSMRDAIRTVVVQDIPEEDFVEFLKLLANRDEEWLSAEGALRGSPHRKSNVAKVWTARARGTEEFVVELGRVLRTNREPWAVEERDSIVGAAVAVLAVNDPPLQAAAFGILLLDKDLPIDLNEATVLRAFVARAVARNIDPDEGEPAEKFLIWLETAKKDLAHIDNEYKARAEVAIEVGYAELAIAYLTSRTSQLNNVVMMSQAITEQISGLRRSQINRTALRATVAPGRSFCSDTSTLIKRLLPNVAGDLRQALQDLAKRCKSVDEALHYMAH